MLVICRAAALAGDLLARRVALSEKDLLPNRELKQRIDAWLQQQRAS